MDVVIVEVRQRRVGTVHVGEETGDVAESCAFVEQKAQPLGKLCVLAVKFLLRGGYAIFGSLAHLGDYHASEQTVQTLRHCEQVGMTPYGDDVAAMLAQIVGVLVAYYQSVETALRVILAIEQALVRAVTQQHDTLAWGDTVQGVSDVGIAVAFIKHLCICSLIESRKHRRSPVFGMYH